MQTSQQNKTKEKKVNLNFSELDDNNKTQFLQFLLKNNIQFEQSNANCQNNNYIAKVTIKDNNMVTKMPLANKNIPSNQRNIKNNDRVSNTKKNDSSKTKTNVNTKKQLISNKQNNADSSKTNKAVKPEIHNKTKSPSHKSIHKQETKTKINKAMSNSPLPQKNHSKAHIDNTYNRQTMSNKSINSNSKSMNSHNKIKSQDKSGKKNMGKQIRTAQFNTNTHTEAILKNNSKERKSFENQVKKVKNKNKEADKSKHSFDLMFDQHKFCNKNQAPSSNVTQNTLELRKKTNYLKQESALLSKYLKIFELRLNGQRTTKWPITQLMKIIEEIYSDIFAKNTHHLAQKNRHTSKAKLNVFQKCLRDYFIQKYKNQKLGLTNLINMLHSLSVYLVTLSASKNESSNNSVIKTLNLFEDFILGIYEHQDLSFFLFIRNMVQRHLKESCTKQSAPSFSSGTLLGGPNRMHEDWQESTIIYPNPTSNHASNNDGIDIGLKLMSTPIRIQEQLQKILQSIFGQQFDLVEEYFYIISEAVKVDNPQNKKSANNIYPIQLFMILLDDYRVKRVLQELKQQQVYKQHNKIQISNQQKVPVKVQQKSRASRKQTNIMKQQENYEEAIGDDLTFGDETKNEYVTQKLEQNNFPEHNMNTFWEIVNKSTLQSMLQLKKQADSQFADNSKLQMLLAHKMSINVKQLVAIMIDNHASGYQSKKSNHGAQNLDNNIMVKNTQIEEDKNIVQDTFNFSLLNANSQESLDYAHDPLFSDPPTVYKLKENDENLLMGTYQLSANYEYSKFDESEQNQFVPKQYCLNKAEKKQNETQQLQTLCHSDFQNIINQKCLTLLGCLLQMDKMKWFEQLFMGKLEEPSDLDIEYVQKLQLQLRKLRKDLNIKAVNQLCKAIITVKQLTYALECLFLLP